MSLPKHIRKLSFELEADVRIDVFLGLGKHTFNVEQKNTLSALIIFWLDELAYQFAMALVKSSILFFYVSTYPHNSFSVN